jgi:competence protein ComEC
VSVLDIGQGDATLLQYGRHAVLVDTGPPRGPVLARLRAAGVDHLDALLVTHAQDDHLGAAADILAALPVGVLFDGRDGVREPWGLRMAAAAARHDVRRWAPAAGDVVRAGPITLRVLWPPADGGATAPARTGDDPNDRAVVARAQVGPLSVLLTADAESGVLAGLDLGHVDVLKVAHHGSADPGLPAVLTRVRPRVAVVSVGAHNRYGHPVPATLRALAAAGAQVFRTDRQGTIGIEPAPRGGLRIDTG